MVIDILKSAMDKDNLSRNISVARCLCAIQLLASVPYNAIVMHKNDVVNCIYQELKNSSLSNAPIAGLQNK